jgi:transcriptional regulator with XRE-family HTH domain
MIFFPVQCQMARAALGWGVRDLAAAAKVSIDTVVRFERGDDLKDRTVEAIQRALEAGGIEFIDENGGGPGVRVRKRQSRKKSQ